MSDDRHYTIDEIPSPTPLTIAAEGNDVLMIMPVHGLGVLTMRATESDEETGRLKFSGVGIFTTAEINGNRIISERDLGEGR